MSNKNEQKNYWVGLVLEFGIIVCIIVYWIPCLLTLLIGGFLVIYGDKILRRLWRINDEYVYSPQMKRIVKKETVVAPGWMILTGTEIVVSFFILLLYMFDVAELVAFFVSFAIYIVLSFIVLFRRYSKLNKNRTDKKVSSDNDCNDFINHDLYNSSEEKPWKPEFIQFEVQYDKNEKPWHNLSIV